MWVVQLESAVFHQTNGSQQAVSLTWLSQDECHKSYWLKRIRAGEMSSGSSGSLRTSVKVSTCGSYQGPLLLEYFIVFCWRTTSHLGFFSDLWRKAFATSALKLCYSKERYPDQIGGTAEKVDSGLSLDNWFDRFQPSDQQKWNLEHTRYRASLDSGKL